MLTLYVAIKRQIQEHISVNQRGQYKGQLLSASHPPQGASVLPVHGICNSCPVRFDSCYGLVAVECLSFFFTFLNGSCYCGYPQSNGHKALFVVVLGVEGGDGGNSSLNL